MKPTPQTYSELQQAYDHFNLHLFDNQLPLCIITLQREKRTMGYFAPDRFVDRDGTPTDEIALNPHYIDITDITETMQTLVHEMVHQWQEHYGSTCRRTYHNKQWADKMESIGLMPSSTGKPGGKRTGQKMADYPIEGGPFLAALDELTSNDFKLSWRDRFAYQQVETENAEGGVEMTVSLVDTTSGAVQPPASPSKIKYTHHCVDADGVVQTNNVWGKPGLSIACGICLGAFEPA